MLHENGRNCSCGAYEWIVNKVNCVINSSKLKFFVIMLSEGSENNNGWREDENENKNDGKVNIEICELVVKVCLK